MKFYHCIIIMKFFWCNYFTLHLIIDVDKLWKLTARAHAYVFTI